MCKRHKDQIRAQKISKDILQVHLLRMSRRTLVFTEARLTDSQHYGTQCGIQPPCTQVRYEWSCSSTFVVQNLSSFFLYLFLYQSNSPPIFTISPHLPILDWLPCRGMGWSSTGFRLPKLSLLKKFLWQEKIINYENFFPAWS